MQSYHNYMPLFSKQSIILAMSQTLLYKIHVSVNFNKIRKRVKKPSFHLRLENLLFCCHLVTVLIESKEVLLHLQLYYGCFQKQGTVL